MSFKEFLSLCRKKKVLILTHAGCDVDALASAAALYLILKRPGQQCRPMIGVPEHINLGARQLAKKMGVPFKLNPSTKGFDCLLLVDLNSFELLGQLAKEVKAFKKPIYLLDHHTKTKDEIALPKFTLIEEHAVSTTELIFKLLKANKLKMDSKTAALIACGIITDSAGFLTADHSTFAVMAEAMAASGKTYAELLELFSVPHDFSEKIARLKAAKRVRIYKLGRFVAVTTDVGSFEAGSAGVLVKIGADIAFAGNLEKNELKVSGRAHSSFIRRIDFDLAKHVFQRLGKVIPEGEGGGHSGAAAFSAKNPSLGLEKALRKCVDLSFEFIKKKNPGAELKEYT